MQGTEIEWLYSLLLHSPSGKVQGSVREDGNVKYVILVWMQAWDDFVMEVENCALCAESHGRFTVYRGVRSEISRQITQCGASPESDIWRPI